MSETAVVQPRKPRWARGDETFALRPDLAYRRLVMVNVAFIGSPGQSEWVLVDAGVHGSYSAIRRAADARFGRNKPPAAIVLTHGHFDHVGALERLAKEWNVPVYAHEREQPFLNGSASYPPPDPSVGGGLMARLSRFYPRGPVNVSRRLRSLPPDGSVPPLPGWRWIHTPGHTPGHVSFWREQDGALIAGDAFVTTDQESAYAVLTQRPEIHGPPMYYTQNWREAEASVQMLAELEPQLAVTGHGPPLQGAPLVRGLRKLAKNFRHVAVPREGRYVKHPASVIAGTAYAKPRR